MTDVHIIIFNRKTLMAHYKHLKLQRFPVFVRYNIILCYSAVDILTPTRRSTDDRV